MPKMLCNFIEVALQHGCSPVNLLHIFRTPFLKNTTEGLLLSLLRQIIVSLEVIPTMSGNIGTANTGDIFQSKNS